MRFWQKLIPDEPFILDDEDEDTRFLNKMPPAVKAWCLASLIANSFVMAIAVAIFRNAAPLLVGAIFALFPLYMLLFWGDIASAVHTAKRKGAERYSFLVRPNLSTQWCAIALCVAAPAFAACVCFLLWFGR